MSRHKPKQLLQKTKPRLFLPSIQAYEKRVKRKLKQFNANDWEYICKYVPLSEPFICQNKENIHWHAISKFQRLSQKFVEQFHNVLNLSVVTKHQLLSESFYIRHKNNVNWKHILHHKRLSHHNLVLLIGHNFKDEHIKAIFIHQLKCQNQQNKTRTK